jgi:hypothetical protein
MTASLKATLDSILNQWLEDQDTHDDRPAGYACDGLAELMADAAAAVYEASHAGAVKGEQEAKA